jgi:hypothetical protein
LIGCILRSRNEYLLTASRGLVLCCDQHHLVIDMYTICCVFELSVTRHPGKMCNNRLLLLSRAARAYEVRAAMKICKIACFT